MATSYDSYCAPSSGGFCITGGNALLWEMLQKVDVPISESVQK